MYPSKVMCRMTGDIVAANANAQHAANSLVSLSVNQWNVFVTIAHHRRPELRVTKEHSTGCPGDAVTIIDMDEGRNG